MRVDAQGKSQRWRNASQPRELSVHRKSPLGRSKRAGSTHSIIPEDNGVLFPLDSNLEVGICANLLEEESENGIGFGLWNPKDASSET